MNRVSTRPALRPATKTAPRRWIYRHGVSTTGNLFERLRIQPSVTTVFFGPRFRAKPRNIRRRTDNVKRIDLSVFLRVGCKLSRSGPFDRDGTPLRNLESIFKPPSRSTLSTSPAIERSVSKIADALAVVGRSRSAPRGAASLHERCIKPVHHWPGSSWADSKLYSVTQGCFESST